VKQSFGLFIEYCTHHPLTMSHTPHGDDEKQQPNRHRRANSELGYFAAHRKSSIQRLEKALVRKSSVPGPTPSGAASSSSSSMIGPDEFINQRFFGAGRRLRQYSTPNFDDDSDGESKTFQSDFDKTEQSATSDKALDNSQNDDDSKVYAPQAMDEEFPPASIICQCWVDSASRAKLEFFKAAYLGRLDVIRRLILDEKIDPDCYATLTEHEHRPGCSEDDSFHHLASKKMHPGPGWPAMCTAAAKGHYDVVEFLLREGAAPDITTVEAETRTRVRYFPLYLACAKGFKNIVNLLLRYRSLYNINLVQQQGYNVVIGACMTGNNDPEILKLVIEAGANVNHLDPKGGSAVFLCAQHNRPDFMRILFKYGALPAPKPSVGHNDARQRNSAPIHIAASRNNTGAMKVLLEHGADVNQKILTSGATALILAAHTGFIEAMKVLVDFDADLDAYDLDRRTALHKACESGHLKAVELLLDNFATVDCIDQKGYTPLMIAVRQGLLPIVKALLVAGASAKHVSERGSSMFDKLFEAIMYGLHWATALQIGGLLIQHGADVNGNSSGVPPLHSACVLQNPTVSCTMMKLLLDNRANVDGVDSSGKTAMHIAAAECRLEAVELLLSYGANVENLDHSGSSPLMDCCGSKYARPELIAVAQLLISKGADINRMNDAGLTSLAAAIMSGNLSMVTFLASQSNLDLSTQMIGRASRMVFFNSPNSDAVQAAFDAGLQRRSEIAFLGGLHSQIGQESRLQDFFVQHPLYDRNLIPFVLKYMKAEPEEAA
jgi:ankyrin repeat protein